MDALHAALSQGLLTVRCNAFAIVNACAGVPVKDVSHYDAYDVAFREVFQGIETPEVLAELLASTEPAGAVGYGA